MRSNRNIFDFSPGNGRDCSGNMASITPEDVCSLTRPTDGICVLETTALVILLGFLCPLSENNFGIEFLNFTISDYDTKNVIFEVGKDSPAPQDMTLDFSLAGDDMYRKIKYTFSEDVLRLPFIQTSCVF